MKLVIPFFQSEFDPKQLLKIGLAKIRHLAILAISQWLLWLFTQKGQHSQVSILLISVGLLGGQRLRLYRANLDRLFNPKNGLSLAFFKKLTIPQDQILGGQTGIWTYVNFLKNAKDKSSLGLKSLSKFARCNLRRRPPNNPNFSQFMTLDKTDFSVTQQKPALSRFSAIRNYFWGQRSEFLRFSII